MSKVIKTRFGVFSLVVASCLVVLPITGALMLVAGCTSTKSEQAVYKTLYVVGTAANTAVDSWLRYYLTESYKASKQTGAASVERLKQLKLQDDQVKKLYGSFQMSYNTALMSAQLNVTNVASTDLIQLGANLVTLVDQFSH